MYSGSVNPPRRAKSQATQNLLSAPSATRHLPTLLPGPSQTSSTPTSPSKGAGNTAASPAQGVNHSASTAAATTTTGPETGVGMAKQTSSPQKPRKRGRKPQAVGSSTRAARESARKANHSRIEKARRLKINGALDELRVLVPAQGTYGKYGVEVESDTSTKAPADNESVGEDNDDEEDDENDKDDDDYNPHKKDVPQKGVQGEKKKGEDKEREFKLDILERTVIFVRYLMERVKQLEEELAEKQIPTQLTTLNVSGTIDTPMSSDTPSESLISNGSAHKSKDTQLKRKNTDSESFQGLRSEAVPRKRQRTDSETTLSLLSENTVEDEDRIQQARSPSIRNKSAPCADFSDLSTPNSSHARENIVARDRTQLKDLRNKNVALHANRTIEDLGPIMKEDDDNNSFCYNSSEFHPRLPSIASLLCTSPSVAHFTHTDPSIHHTRIEDQVQAHQYCQYEHQHQKQGQAFEGLRCTCHHPECARSQGSYRNHHATACVNSTTCNNSHTAYNNYTRSRTTAGDRSPFPFPYLSPKWSPEIRTFHPAIAAAGTKAGGLGEDMCPYSMHQHHDISDFCNPSPSSSLSTGVAGAGSVNDRVSIFDNPTSTINNSAAMAGSGSGCSSKSGIDLGSNFGKIRSSSSFESSETRCYKRDLDSSINEIRQKKQKQQKDEIIDIRRTIDCSGATKDADSDTSCSHKDKGNKRPLKHLMGEKGDGDVSRDISATSAANANCTTTDLAAESSVIRREGRGYAPRAQQRHVLPEQREEASQSKHGQDLLQRVLLRRERRDFPLSPCEDRGILRGRWDGYRASQAYAGEKEYWDQCDANGTGCNGGVGDLCIGCTSGRELLEARDIDNDRPSPIASGLPSPPPSGRTCASSYSGVRGNRGSGSTNGQRRDDVGREGMWGSGSENELRGVVPLRLPAACLDVNMKVRGNLGSLLGSLRSMSSEGSGGVRGSRGKKRKSELREIGGGKGSAVSAIREEGTAVSGVNLSKHGNEGYENDELESDRDYEDEEDDEGEDVGNEGRSDDDEGTTEASLALLQMRTRSGSLASLSSFNSSYVPTTSITATSSTTAIITSATTSSSTLTKRKHSSGDKPLIGNTYNDVRLAPSESGPAPHTRGVTPGSLLGISHLQ